jgi:tetratricopeptide (TPR) repeat protein
MRRPAVCLLLLLLFTATVVSAQAGAVGSLDWYDSEAKQAISQSNYETAVRILTEAKGKFPDASKINLELADLYYDKELYPLALDEYRDAEKKGSEDFHTLNQIARSYGKLNREKDSIGYLTRILSLYPDSVETIDDLGWMYFKTFQLEKGEKILLAGIKKFGLQRNMAMTLGTIYSGMNNYDRSREYYLKSIDDALSANDRYFASIAYYNLSLLEESFYHYNSALAFTEDSVSMEDRASGHLARGELIQSRMDFRGALEEYQKAFERDSTPLTRVNLAILHRLFGHLELARRYAEEAFGTKDLAWMLYYGTDVSRHYKDLSEILSDVYRGLSRVEATRPTAGPFDRVVALAVSLRDRVISWYYAQRFRLYSLAIGKQYMAEGRWEEASWEFYKASQPYREVAATYLAKARALETARTPHAEPFYLQEEGKLRGSVELLTRSIAGFDPFWEREATADSLTTLAPLLARRGETAARRDALNRLYDINPGAFRQEALGLPLSLQMPENFWGRWEKALIVRYFRRAGSEIVESRAGGSPPPSGFRYALSLSLQAEGKARYALTDVRSGQILVENSRQLSGGAFKRCAALVQGILDDLYKVQ